LTLNGWLQIALFCAIVVLLTRPVGGYLTRLFAGERTLLSPVLRPLEVGLYRLSGIDERS
jgi:K+-transporting ATPase ATPase A chain